MRAQGLRGTGGGWLTGLLIETPKEGEGSLSDTGFMSRQGECECTDQWELVVSQCSHHTGFMQTPVNRARAYGEHGGLCAVEMFGLPVGNLGRDDDTIPGRFQKDHWGREVGGDCSMGDRMDDSHQGISWEAGGGAGRASQGTYCLLGEEGSVVGSEAGGSETPEGGLCQSYQFRE